MNWLLEMTDTPALPAPELEMLPCGHEGVAGKALCFICYSNMMHEIATIGRAYLHASDNALELLKRLGLSRSTIWRALKRGWFTLPYEPHAEMILETERGGFAELKDPYAFAHSQVTHVLNLWMIGLDDRTLAEDMVQEGLLKCWELRCKPRVKSWPAFFSTVIRRRVQDLLPRELKYALWGGAEEVYGEERMDADARAEERIV